MDLETCMGMIAASSSCVLKEPVGLPSVPEGLVLPTDVRAFYERAGGATLFPNALYAMEIVQPKDFVRANPIIRLESGEYDVSYNWFIIAQSEPQYITIDLNPGRLGRCYDSFWETHALRGDSPIVARSFTELLVRLFEAQGRELYWLAKEFVTPGDAYDDVVD